MARRSRGGMVEAEARRIRVAIARAILAAAAVPGCASASSGGEPEIVDATVDRDGTTTTMEDAAPIDDAPAANDALDAGIDCAPSAPYFIDASNVIVGGLNCFYFVDYPCGASFTGFDGGSCYLTADECAIACTLPDAAVFDCQYWPNAGCSMGTITAEAGQPATVACGVCYGIGRRPAGLARPAASRARRASGRHWALASFFEAASIVAFDDLASDLSAIGAPRELVHAARQSAREEARHAKITARLARREGAAPSSASVRRRSRCSVLGVARANAIEGCVRETFGALVATWQAEHAADANVRAAMRGIARDETRHAALAWAIASWSTERLDAADRARIARDVTAAIDELRRELSAPVDPALVRDVGLPDAARAEAMLDRIARELWTSFTACA